MCKKMVGAKTIQTDPRWWLEKGKIGVTMKPTISKPFKSNDRTFDKVYNTFDKRDYFNSKGFSKTQIGNFERPIKKNDKGAQQVLDLFKGDEKKQRIILLKLFQIETKKSTFNNYKAP